MELQLKECHKFPYGAKVYVQTDFLHQIYIGLPAEGKAWDCSYNWKNGASNAAPIESHREYSQSF